MLLADYGVPLYRPHCRRTVSSRDLSDTQGMIMSIAA